MADLKRRYKTRFVVSATLYNPPAAERMEATASLDKLRTLLPRDIDPENYPTLLFVAGNLAVGSVVNLNHDAMTLEDTLATYRSYEWQLVDIEHLRSDIKGFIVKAGLSELGTDRLITEDEARAAGKPVNVAIVVALWKVADPDLCAFIEQMDAPASPDKGKLSFSFEVGFDDYDIVVLPNGATNLALASQIVTPDAPEFHKLDKLLRVNGGKGALGKDSYVARIIMGNIIPLGAGIVTVPAAAVKGLTTITSNPHVDDATAAAQVEVVDAGLYSYSSTQVTLSETDAAPFKAYSASIPDDHIYTDPDDPTLGRDSEPHCTALYGIVGADASPIQACLAGCGPITMTLGKVSMFETSVEAKKPYDVLKIDVHSDDLHRIHHLIKTATATETKWPEYHPHLTVAYCKPGMARGYVGDTRFEGKTLTFSSITFSPHTGDRVELALGEKPSPHTDQIGQVPVQPTTTPDTSMAQNTPLISIATLVGKKVTLSAINTEGQKVLIEMDAAVATQAKTKKAEQDKANAAQLKTAFDKLGSVLNNTLPEVYSGEAMATPSRQIKLSEGWQTRLAALQTEAGKQGNAPLVNGVNITLSDGRTFTNVKVFDGTTLELDKELSMSGVVLTDMTPGVPPQADDPEILHPHKAVVYPTTSPEQQARDAAIEDQRRAAQNAAYTDAAVAKALTEINTILAGVSPSNLMTLPMNLSELKQSLAAVKTVEDLPTAVANVALFADAIAQASEKLVAERKTATEAAATAQAAVDQIKADLDKLTKTHNEMVAAQQAAAAEAQFNSHMSATEATFDLDDDIRAEIVAEVKACVTDEAFAKWLASAKKKMKGWMKKGEKPGDKANDKEPDGDGDDAKAALAAKTALASAAANIVDAPVHHDFEAAKTLQETMQATFAKNTSIGGVKIAKK